QNHGKAPAPLVVLVAVLVWIANSMVGSFSTLLNTALYCDRRAALGDVVVHAEPADIGIAQATVASLATAPSGRRPATPRRTTAPPSPDHAPRARAAPPAA